MSDNSKKHAKILLKARPTPEQLADRLSDALPDGLELYLDAADIDRDDWLATLEGRIDSLALPSDFDWVVEGPLRSLDGTFFDVSRLSPANVEVLRRLTTFGRAIGARAAVIHAIAPVDTAMMFSGESHARAMRESLALLRLYADLCSENGLVPTIENIPAVTKMREARFMHSLIGMAPRDLLDLCARVDGLKVTLDVSHAQLYLNAAGMSELAAPEEIVPMIRYLAPRREASNLAEYIDQIEHLIFEAHFSNARGLLGEGLPYCDGELDLDWAVARLKWIADYLVTEIIEPDPNKSMLMREAESRMKTALACNNAVRQWPSQSRWSLE